MANYEYCYSPPNFQGQAEHGDFFNVVPIILYIGS